MLVRALSAPLLFLAFAASQERDAKKWVPVFRNYLATTMAPPAKRAAVTAAPAVPVAAAPAVHISNFTFGPALLKVRVGQTVTWTNDDDIPHTVVAADHSFKSKVLDTAEHFSFTFTKVGLVSYFCSLHPHMTGKVMVTAK